MRRRYLVGYDIADPKRLRKMYKTMRGYGDSLQYSVFLCDLTSMERALMMEDVRSVMHERDDRVFLVDLGRARKTQRIEFLGKQPDQLADGAAVII